MSGKRRRRRRKNWFMRLSVAKKAALCIGGVLICLAASGVIYVAAKLNKIDTDNSMKSDDIVVNKEAEISAEGYTNVALFGIDSREGDLDKGSRTDCLIVASLDNKTKEVRLASVYRDTLLDIGDGELQKCNAAYSFGGPTQAINMLNKNLDLNIQDYVTFDFAAVAKAIDALGGVEIDVKEEEVQYLNKFLGETARVAGTEAHEVTKSGKQLLDGTQATTYARIRSTAGGDFTRTERQRLVIEKMAEKLQQSKLTTINNIIDEILPTIKTSFSATDILAYAKDFAKYKIADSTGFPFDKTTDTISGLGSIVIPVTLESNVQKLHEFFYSNETYTTSADVLSISAAVTERVGNRSATDDSTLNSQTYTTAQEDQAQEHNSYTRGTTNSSNSGRTTGSYSNSGTTGTYNSYNSGNTGSSGSGTAGNTANSGSTSQGTTGGNTAGGSTTGGNTTTGGTTSSGTTDGNTGNSGSASADAESSETE